MKVYIEVMLLDNLWADALVLFGTTKWLQTPYRKWRVWISAGLGTLYAVFSMAKRFVWLQFLPIKIGVSFVMVWVAYGYGGKKRYAKHCAVFWLFSVLLAAGVQLYGALFGQVRAVGGALALSGPPLWAFLACSWGAGALALWVQQKTRQKAVQVKHEYFATICIGKTQASAVCLMDSGHSLYCPISGLPVLFWPYDQALQTAVETEKLESQPLRFATASGQSEVKAYRPCTVTMQDKQHCKTVRCALVLSHELGQTALYPASAAIGYFEEE